MGGGTTFPILYKHFGSPPGPNLCVLRFTSSQVSFQNEYCGKTKINTKEDKSKKTVIMASELKKKSEDMNVGVTLLINNEQGSTLSATYLFNR